MPETYGTAEWWKDLLAIMITELFIDYGYKRFLVYLGHLRWVALADVWEFKQIAAKQGLR